MLHCIFPFGHMYQFGSLQFPFAWQLSSQSTQSFGFRTIPVIDSYTMSESPVQNFEGTPNSGVSLPTPKRNRWKRSQRPPGQDHSLGFPRAQRASDNESTSTQSEVILFQSPIMSVEESGSLGQSSSTVLPPISESRATGQSTPQGSQTPVFGTLITEEDPWLTSDDQVHTDLNQHNPRREQSNQTVPFNYGALIWRCLREGDDPWKED